MNYLNNILGGFDMHFKTLLLFIIIDYITGILRAIYNKQLNSRIGAKGIIKKVGYILIVIISSLLDNLLNSSGKIRDLIIYMFIANEGISILENWAKMGIKIPKFLKDKFKEISNEVEEKIEK